MTLSELKATLININYMTSCISLCEDGEAKGLTKLKARIGHLSSHLHRFRSSQKCRY